jgi:hypothetical protein
MAIVITGSVAFDYLMTFPGYFKQNILPDKLDKPASEVDALQISRILWPYLEKNQRYLPPQE